MFANVLLTDFRAYFSNSTLLIGHLISKISQVSVIKILILLLLHEIHVTTGVRSELTHEIDLVLHHNSTVQTTTASIH